MVTDLEWAVRAHSSVKKEQYDTYCRYYEGDQNLAFATEKFRNTFGSIFREFAENLCSPVVDSLSDRLQITGFKTNQASVQTETVQSPTVSGAPEVIGGHLQKVTVQDPLAEQILALWNYNRMDLGAAEVHQNALRDGDAYVIVWPDADGKAEIFPNEACHCEVQYDPNSKRRILRGTKVWFDYVEKHWRVNVYLPDRIEKYMQKTTSMQLASKESSFQLLEVVPNPYGVVPMFHFPNAKVGRPGSSELKNIIPLQDALNKSVMDMMIAMEFASFKQRYIIGLEVETDEETGEPIDPTYRNYGVERMLAIPDLEAKVGQFDATDLGQFLRVQEKFWASVARVSGTPLHYFFITQGDFPSGEAMKSAEARFVKKITDRQTAFGNVWEDVMKFCLRIEDVGVPDDLTIETVWHSAAPKSEAEQADTAVKKKAVGVSRSQILREMGYDDETIYRMLQESDAYNATQMALQQRPDQQATNPNGQPKPQGPGTQGVQK